MAFPRPKGTYDGSREGIKAAGKKLPEARKNTGKKIS